MWKYLALVVVVLGLAGGAYALTRPSEENISANSVVAQLQGSAEGYARALEPWDWQFPRDHGPHPAFQTEWWYYTGNVSTPDGRRFGYQFTIFRRAIAPSVTESASEWRTNQFYMAHFTVTDVEGKAFYHDQALSRGAAGLAGASVAPRYRVWVEGWQVFATNDEATQTRIEAAADGYRIALDLTQLKPPALQGDRGLSAKSGEAGNASYYYSLSRLATEGEIQIGNQVYPVTGFSWMDHEFSTSALALDAEGWDWFGLHLDDGRDLMLGQIRLREGGREPAFGGLLVEADGTTRYLPSDSFSITATDTWTSQKTGATYPSGWRLDVELGAGESLSFSATPLLRDQELTDGFAYWEGAVQLAGDVTGYGYAELTGYVGENNGRF
jgi:predicted secreted hydrolase